MVKWDEPVGTMCDVCWGITISKWSKKPAKHRIWSRHGNENCSHSTFSNCYVHVLQIRSCLLCSPCFLGAFKDIFLTFHQLKGRWFIYRKWKPQHRLGHRLRWRVEKWERWSRCHGAPQGPASFLAEIVQQWNSLFCEGNEHWEGLSFMTFMILSVLSFLCVFCFFLKTSHEF